MLIDFFLHLKERRVPATITEYLALLEALQAGLANCRMDDFYALARMCLVKNEAHYDRFDVAFGEYFDKIHMEGGKNELPEGWLQNAADNVISTEALAALDIPLIEDLPKMEQSPAAETEHIEDDRQKMMGGGNSPIGLGGINREGIRLEGVSTGNRKAIKPWDSRQFQGLDDEVELGTRNIKMALRRLRKFAREGAADELDMEETIRATARNAGWLELVMRPERRNKVKVLLLFDIGGTMAAHVKQCEELFSAAKTEFKHMDHFYFHNCVYDTVWKYDNPSTLTHYPLPSLINKFGKDYKLILVGDATMGPTEITLPHESDYHQTHSQHSGEVWMRSLLNHFKHAAWLNPEPQRFWKTTQSIQMISEIMEGRMYPLTLRGLDDAMRTLSK